HQHALVLDGGAARDGELRPHLPSEDVGERGLAEPRRTRQKDVIERLAAVAGGLHVDAQVFLVLALADEVVERLRGGDAGQPLVGGVGVGRDRAILARCGCGVGDAVSLAHGALGPLYDTAGTRATGAGAQAGSVTRRLPPWFFRRTTSTLPPCSSVTARARRSPSARPRCSCAPGSRFGSSIASRRETGKWGFAISISMRTDFGFSVLASRRTADASVVRSAWAMNVASARGMRTRSTGI